MKKVYQHKKCNYIFGCDNSTYGGGRGFCPTHYSCYHSRVARGTATWEKLEEWKEGTEKERERLRCRFQKNYPYSRLVYKKVN